MRFSKYAATIPALALALSAGTANAASVTPDIIFGDGNANGGFTVTNTELDFPSNPIGGNLELGLRAKLRYDASGGPQNQFNWDGVDTYSFDQANGNPPSGRAMWNFEWSVNVEDLKNEDTGAQLTIGQLLDSGARLELSYDSDPTSAVNFTSYDLFGTSGTGYYVGDNNTPNGQKNSVVVIFFSPPTKPTRLETAWTIALSPRTL